jgi:hypothetical protein
MYIQTDGKWVGQFYEKKVIKKIAATVPPFHSLLQIILTTYFQQALFHMP